MYTEEEFIKAFIPHRNRLEQLCKQMMPNDADADDAVQEIYLRLWEHRQALPIVRQPLAYLIRTARNYCLDRLRGYRYSLSIDVIGDDEPAESDEPARTEEIYQRIYTWSEMLEEPQRSVFRMVHYEQTSQQEVARTLGLSEANVRTILSRLRSALRNQIKSEEEQ